MLLETRLLEKRAKTATLILLLLLAPLSEMFSEEVAWTEMRHYERDGVDMLLEGTAAINTGQGWETYYFAFQPYFQLDTTHVTAFAGLQLTSGTYDMTGGVIYWPLVGTVVKAGISARYNMNYYDNICLTHNILLGGSLEARPLSWLGFKASLSAMLKSRSIFAIDDDRSFLHQLSYAFSGEIDIYLPYEIMAYFSLATYERYRYMLAVAPSFTLGATKQLPHKFYAGLEGVARYTDFFTASTFYDSCEIRIFAGRTF